MVDFAFATQEEILRELGERLRTQRLAQSLTQKDLAAMAGLALGTVKTLERSGSCSLETLIRVVQVLGLSDELQRLFVLQRQSIAQMQQAEQAMRQRAPRSKKP